MVSVCIQYYLLHLEVMISGYAMHRVKYIERSFSSDALVYPSHRQVTFCLGRSASELEPAGRERELPPLSNSRVLACLRQARLKHHIQVIFNEPHLVLLHLGIRDILWRPYILIQATTMSQDRGKQEADKASARRKREVS